MADRFIQQWQFPAQGNFAFMQRDGGPMLPRDGGPMLPRDGGPMLPRDGGPMLPRDGGPMLPRDGGPMLPRDGGPMLPRDGGPMGPMMPRHDGPMLHRHGAPMLQRDGGPMLQRDGGPMLQRDGGPMLQRDGGPMLQRVGGPMLQRDGGPMLQRDGGPMLQRDGGPMLQRDGGPMLQRDGGPMLQRDGGPMLQRDGGPMLQRDGGPMLQRDGGPMLQRDGGPMLPRDGGPMLPRDGGPMLPRDGGPMLQRDGGPMLQRDGSFLYQHGASLQNECHLMLQGNPSMQGPSMHPNRQGDGMWTFGENRPLDKDMFQHWLSSFLAYRKNKLPPESEPTRTCSVTEARELIYGALSLVSQLKTLCQTLQSSAESKEAWAQEFPKAAKIHAELQSRMKKLEEPGYIQSLKRKLRMVQKKRLRQQRAKQETEEDKEATERAAEREAKIDQWRMQCIHEVEERKKERELKAAADSVLSEVRKKQADAKKMLDVLRSLEKLRKLRKEAAGRKGVFPPQSADVTFENHIQRLRAMVHKRVALYDVEERALNVILEGEQEEERQRDKEKRMKKEKDKVIKLQQEVDSVLFGNPDTIPPVHPLQPFRQYYMQAEHSVVSLVQIRREWDRFLVPPDHPDGSSIPRGWVLPKPPSSETWATAVLQTE
ncbi:programmed cell death protein 7 [Pelodytes ibericus]